MVGGVFPNLCESYLEFIKEQRLELHNLTEKRRFKKEDKKRKKDRKFKKEKILNSGELHAYLRKPGAFKEININLLEKGTQEIPCRIYYMDIDKDYLKLKFEVVHREISTEPFFNEYNNSKWKITNYSLRT